MTGSPRAHATGTTKGPRSVAAGRGAADHTPKVVRVEAALETKPILKRTLTRLASAGRN
jgi:hypothetical protein